MEIGRRRELSDRIGKFGRKRFIGTTALSCSLESCRQRRWTAYHASVGPRIQKEKWNVRLAVRE